MSHRRVSFTFVSSFGLSVLRSYDYRICIVDIGKPDIFSDAFEENMIARSQQIIDYYCRTNEMYRKLTHMLKDPISFVDHSQGHVNLVRARIKLNDDTIIAKLSSGKEYVIKDDNKWNLQAYGLPLICSICDKINLA